MANERFYLRIRGKVSGPFDDASLRSLIKRGALSRIHQISRDQVNWENAGRFEGLFPAPIVTADIPAPDQGPAQAPFEAPESGAPAASMAAVFYEANGQSAGPVPVAVVESMILNGAIPADALVWTADDGQRRAARDHPLLRDVAFPDAAGSARANFRLRSTLSTLVLAAACISVVAVGAYEANRLTAKPTNPATPARPQPMLPPASRMPSMTPPPAVPPPLTPTPMPSPSSAAGAASTSSPPGADSTPPTPKTTDTIAPTAPPQTPSTPQRRRRGRKKAPGP